MQLSTQNAFQVIFPKYVELLTESPLYTDDGLQTFIRDELPHKIELVRSIEPTFLAFQTQFTNLILKRPKQQNLIQSLTLKASQKIEKLFYNLEVSTDKQVNKGSLSNELYFLNIQQIRTRFREQLKDLQPLLKEKYFDCHQLDKHVEEQIARKLYSLNELYYFLKNDLNSIASRFRIKEHQVLNQINKTGTSQNSFEISEMIYLDEKLIENIREIVDKRYRPFLGKKDFFYSKVKQIQNESESKVPMNITALVQSILSKEKYRANKEITASLSKQLKNLDESLEQEVERDCKEIISDVDSLKKEFNQLKNNVFYLDIIRGTFTEKYKLELNKLENVYYLSNIEKYLQDVQTFTQKLIRVEQKIIQNRKGFMKRLGKQIEQKIATVTTEYELKNSSSSSTLQDLIVSEFSALKDNLYGMIGDEKSSNTQTFNNRNIENIKQQKVNELQKRRLEVERAREQKQLQRRRQMQQKAQKQRMKREQDRVKLEEKRRAEDERIRKMKEERQDAERIRKMQQAQKQRIRQIQMEEKRKHLKIKEEQERQRVREQMKRKEEEKKKKEAEDAKMREKLKSEKEIQDKRRLEETQNKRREAEEIKRRKEEQQRAQQQRLREEKQRSLKIKRQQEQREQREREKIMEQEKQERQRRERQLRAQRERQEQERKDQQERQRNEREAKLAKQKKEKQLKEQQEREERERQKMAQMEKQRAENQSRQRERLAKLQKEKRQHQEREKREKEQRQRRERQQIQRREQKEQQEREERQRRQRQQREKRERKQKEEREQREKQQKLLKEKQEKERKQKQEKEKRERQQKQRKQQQRKEQQEKQRLAKQKEERQRQQRDKKQKQEADRQAKIKLEERLKKEKQEKQQSELQLLMQQEENAKKNKSKVSNDRKSKGGSGINYDDLDDIMDDDLEELQQKESKVSKNHDNDGEYGDDYEDDFESPEKDEEGQGAMIEPKELITKQSIKCLNDYMKGTSYARKNKPNLEPFNNKESYAYLFEEFTENKKLFIFDASVSKAVLDFSKELMDENAAEEDLKMSIQTIKEEMFNDYAKSGEEENFDPRTTLILPFSFANEFDIKLIEFLPAHGWFRPVLGTEIADQEMEAKFNSILQGLLHIFEIENDPQIETVVIPEESKLVLETFDKDLPCLLVIFAMHYEMDLKQEIQITQYTVQRFFYTIQILKPYYETLQNNQEDLVKFYETLHEKYSENEPIRILPLEIESSDPQYEGKLQQYSLQAKQMFLDDQKISTLLVLFQVLIAPEEEEEEESGANFEKISIYCSIERTAPKPTISYFIVSKDDLDKENASTLFDIVSQGDDGFEVNVFMDFTRHNGLSSYSDWTLPLWAKSIQKRKLTATNAFRALSFAMSPYYIAYKEQD